MQRERITVFDTTLRDGEQSPGCSMSLPEKVRMARQLERLGVDVIEAGFPIASQGDFDAVQAVASEIGSVSIAGLARARAEDIHLAWEALKKSSRPRIHVFLATSEIHLHYKLKITREQALQQAAESVALARSFCADVEFSPEDATRSDLAYLTEVCQAVVAAGATTVNIPDTVGYTVPDDMSATIRHLRAKLPAEAVISVHCHNDLGLAAANSLAGIHAGARQVECTINGIGERAGNASLEELVMVLQVRPDANPFFTSVRTHELYPSSRMLSEITGVSVQPNKAIVGRNAFAHEAGIHQDGVIKNPLCYEIMTPQSVGVPENRLVLGKHSGRHALGLRYRELGYELDRRDLDRIYRRFVTLADAVKEVHDKHLLTILAEEMPTQRVAITAEAQRTIAGSWGNA